MKRTICAFPAHISSHNQQLRLNYSLSYMCLSTCTKYRRHLDNFTISIYFDASSIRIDGKYFRRAAASVGKSESIVVIGEPVRVCFQRCQCNWALTSSSTPLGGECLMTAQEPIATHHEPTPDRPISTKAMSFHEFARFISSRDLLKWPSPTSGSSSRLAHRSPT